MTRAQKAIGQRIRQKRLARKLSQERLAKKLGLSQGMISRMETGDKPMSWRTREKIKKELRMRV